jgi:hypothetical protein
MYVEYSYLVVAVLSDITSIEYLYVESEICRFELQVRAGST